jgi:hypothetical protein
MIDRFVSGELIAYGWMRDLEGWGMTNTDDRSFHDAGNKVIALAEQIKAERAVSAMNN